MPPATLRVAVAAYTPLHYPSTTTPINTQNRFNMGNPMVTFETSEVRAHASNTTICHSSFSPSLSLSLALTLSDRSWCANFGRCDWAHFYIVLFRCTTKWIDDANSVRTYIGRHRSRFRSHGSSAKARIPVIWVARIHHPMTLPPRTPIDCTHTRTKRKYRAT